MSLSKSLTSVAGKVINKFGGDVTMRYVTGGSYNATTGAVNETVSDTVVKGVLQDITAREISDRGTVSNDLIQSGDKRLVVAATDLATAPETKDRVVISSVVHQIVRVNTTEQANSPITYELILRA